MAPSDELPGRFLGDRYRVLGRLGAGASATVYLAEDEVLGRAVAVKVLHPALAADQSFLRRFQSEARAAAQLRHPHIVQVYDWGQDPLGVYVVLEHLAGGNLRQVLDANGALELPQVVAMGLAAAQGLGLAHQRGTAHRDIKPANLLFDEEGRLAIADFGLARAMADATWTEPAGVILGTARYSSPEQAGGQPTGPATDIYSLCLVLAEAATGSVPFQADTIPGTLMARQGQRVPVGPELGELGPILAAASDPDPATRPGAAWMASELAGLARRLPPPSLLRLAPPVPPGPPYPAAVPGGGGTGGTAAEAASLTAVGLPRVPTDGTHDPDSAPTVAWAASEGAEEGAAGVAPLAAVGGAPVAAATAAGAAEVGPPGPPPRAHRSPWRGGRGWALAAAAGVAALAVLVWVLLGVLHVATPSYAVPKLVGQPLGRAEAALVADHLGYRLGAPRYSETVPAGAVVAQDPVGGQAREGTRIVLVSSKGPAPRDVPGLTGLTEAAAKAKLSAAGFVAAFTSDYSETVPLGTVLSWSPSSGLQAKGATVAVVVSGGPQPRVVPNLSGDSYSQAAAALQAMQLVASQTSVYSSSVPAGQVVSTSPGAGVSVARGSTVVVNVSKGPQTVAVPDVSGDSVAQATAALQADGLTVGGVYGPSGHGRVFATDPTAGSTVDVGTSVDLYTF